MDALSRRKIEETVLDILRKSNLEEMTELRVRDTASERLGFDLSDMERKSFVRGVVENFLLSASTSEPQLNAREELMETNVEGEQDTRSKEASEVGDRVICKLSDKRNVVVHDFKEKTWVSIREFYKKDGKQLPSPRGITLSAEQWATFKKSVPAVEEAIKKMESNLRSGHYSKQTEDGKQSEDMSNSLTGLAHHELASIETGRFDGKNFPLWAQHMEFLFKQLKIAYVLYGPCPSTTLGPEASTEEIAQSKAAEQKWMNDDFVCRRGISNALSDDLFYLYSKKTMTAKELWEDLKLLYLYEEFGTKRSLVKKYIEFQMLEGKSILEQVKEFNNIADSIVASGMMVEENFHVSVIISKLPSSWKDVVIKLMREEILPFAMLMDRLRVEEESRIREKQGVPVNPVGNVNRYKAPKYAIEEARTEDMNPAPRMRDMKPRNMQWKRQGLETNGKVICQFCGKKGHISEHCRYRSRNVDKESNDKKHEGNGSMPAIMEVNIFEGAVNG